MREILYIQAGPLANYTGTHFWNTQEAYFTYGDDGDEPLVDHAISFRETVAGKGEPLLCPRLLVFNRKANFGTLSKDLLSQDDSGQDDDTGSNLWNGDVVEYRQPAIAKSPYHDKLDSDEADLANDDGDDAPAVRYWSDFNRLYYPPKTVQKLPDIADWEDKEGDWEDGRALFRRFDEDTDVMDDAVRAFAEECDALQGVQLAFDTPAAGGFTAALLAALRDEYAKLSLLAFPLLSDALAAPLDVDDHRGRRKALNDALVLRSLHELVPLSVPLQSPSTWPKTLDGVQLNTEDIYHTSALLSAHIESATLPLRLRAGREDLAGFASHLTWRGTTRFAELSGRSALNPDSRLFNFSSLDSSEAGSDLEFATRDVARGFSLPQTTAYNTWRAEYHLREPFLLSTHAPLYPIPSSFPPIFPPTAPEKRARAVPLFTSLSTIPRTAALFRRHATFVEANLGAGAAGGLDRDEMKELGNDLWRVCDGYDGEDGGGGGGEGDFGEDEE
ncbi:hypothetical protein HWV62_27377 [Athelia sp. TMB]|nr:hypothetical protein HWV62_27377 [Athelia sp. TMB]